jgi:FlaA1/EpsC-like NDP-sugar epimerase
MGLLSAEWVLALPRPQKRMIALTANAFLCVATVVFAFYLRLGFWVIPRGTSWMAVIVALAVALPIFITSGMYRAIFRFSGWSALEAVARAGAIYGAIYATVFTLIGIHGVPRTVGIIQPILLLLAVGASRALVRFWLGDGYESRLRRGGESSVLIYGAGSAGRQLAAAMATAENVRIVGFIDDDLTLQGSILNGKRIYPSDDLSRLVRRLGVRDVLLALPSIGRSKRAAILAAVREAHVTVRTLPAVSDLAHGRVTVSDLRELQIEDLLGREMVAPNAALLSKNITGNIVMVTGAGGSIGSELCRQILPLRPKTLLLVDINEFGLYSIHEELAGRPDASVVQLFPMLASVCDDARLTSIFAHWKPDIVYHAAAYKHVPLVEHNAIEGVRNNVFGTLTIAETAVRHGTKDLVLISTDKAVRPTSTMGASKRLSEMILQSMSCEQKTTRMSMVRFGNVLGSSGSVVPRFRRQIQDGGPVTITHHEMTRYFMTIPEAAQLVIQAGAMADGGEVFILDMGEPVRIIDLATNMIALSGLTVIDEESPDGDIAINFIGLRPGEKLYEELLIDENAQKTAHSRIMKASERLVGWEDLSLRLDSLRGAIDSQDAGIVREMLQLIVPEFTPNDGVMDWLHIERTMA